MVVIGFGSILMAATANTTIQLAVPDHLRGRVMSVYTTVFSASVPIGGLAMGAVASGFGASLAIAIGGVLSVAVGPGRARMGPPGRLRDPGDAVGRDRVGGRGPVERASALIAPRRPRPAVD